MQYGGDALTVAGGIDDQHDRCLQEAGDVCGGSGGRRHRVRFDPAVEEAHDPFDDGDVGPGTAMPVQRPDAVCADQHRIKVAAGSAGRQGVVTGVDEVRSDLERRHPVAGFA